MSSNTIDNFILEFVIYEFHVVALEPPMITTTLLALQVHKSCKKLIPKEFLEIREI